MKTKDVTVRLAEETVNRLHVKAGLLRAERGQCVTLSDVVREALAAYFRQAT
jgi:predicted transcriptional regulator